MRHRCRGAGEKRERQVVQENKRTVKRVIHARIPAQAEVIYGRIYAGDPENPAGERVSREHKKSSRQKSSRHGGGDPCIYRLQENPENPGTRTW